MDVVSYRLALAMLGLGCLSCVIAIAVIAIDGRDPPTVLSAIGGTFAGALAMAIHQPRYANGSAKYLTPPPPRSPDGG